MKKVLAVFMAVLMAFGVCAFGASAKEPVPTCTFQEALDAAKALGSVLLVFDFGSCETGTVPVMTNSYWKQIDYGTEEITDENGNKKVVNIDGDFDGCYVVYGSSYAPSLSGKLPGIKNAPEGYVASWKVQGAGPGEISEIIYSGDSTPSAGNYSIPQQAVAGSYILFTVEMTINKKEPVINKVLAILAKIIAMIFGDEIGNLILGLVNG